MKRDIKKIILLLCIPFIFCNCATLGTEASTKHTSLDYSRAVLGDAPVQDYVNRVAKQLTAHVNQTDPLSINVDALKTSRIQATSSLNSSRVDITRGMLNVLANEAQLACLMGHEIGHKVLHRENQQYKSEKSLQNIFLSEEMSKAKWNQKKEEEADEYGAMLCYQAGYDPYAFLDFMNWMAGFQKSDFFSAINEWTATHKDFENRAEHLQGFLEKSHIPPGKGILKREEYVRALASLRSIHTGDAVNELLPGGIEKAFQKLDSIEQELQDHLKNRTPLSVTHFLDTMETLSDLARRYEITEFTSADSAFMKEILSQDTPIWDNDALKLKIEETLKQLSRLGIGLVPVAGDAIDLYEFLTGKEFGTNQALSLNERIITAAGLLAGSGKMWREAANGIELTLKETNLVNKVGKRAAADGRYALKEAGNVLEAAKSGKVVVIGYFPRYLQKAEEIGARRFNIPPKIWNKMTKAEQWAANQQFLDRAIHRGDDIILSSSVKNIDNISGTFRQELDYLIDRGYQLSKDGTRMIKQ